MGVVLFSGAIIISLFAMRARAPEWLLMSCGGWTLFTLLNVTWQPLMAFQLALVWGGYAFLAPKALPQRKFWEAKFWNSMPWDAAKSHGINFVQVINSGSPSIPPPMNMDEQQTDVSPERSSSRTTEEKRRPLNKLFITQLFIWIFSINVLIHLIPFNYSQAIVIDQVARSAGSTLAIFVISLIGLIFTPNQTIGMTSIAILISPLAIVADRANDPLALQYFRELLYPDGMSQIAAQSNMDPATTDGISIDQIPVEPDYVDDTERRRQQANRIAEMATSGVGYESATQIERDYLTLTPNQFAMKYGNEVAANLQADVSNVGSTRR